MEKVVTKSDAEEWVCMLLSEKELDWLEGQWDFLDILIVTYLKRYCPHTSEILLHHSKGEHPLQSSIIRKINKFYRIPGLNKAVISDDAMKFLISWSLNLI
jgi:phage FluMu protein Com